MDFANWKRSEQVSVGVTLAFALVSGFLAFIPTTVFVQAIAAGALGGLFHEIAQSGGKIFFMQKREDGLYLGSLTGMVLGSVAGLMLLQGFLPSARVCDTNTTGTPETECVEFSKKTGNAANVRLILEIFLAGMALKGVAEAASGQEVPLGSLQPIDGGQQPVNPLQPIDGGQQPVNPLQPVDGGQQPVNPLQPVDGGQQPVNPGNPASAPRGLRPTTIDPNIP